MPKLSEHKSKSRNRILLLGDPGAGKTTAVGHLLNHGQRLFVADFDDGLEPIRAYVKPEFHKNLIYETLVDRVHPDINTGYPVTTGKPHAFRRFIKLTQEWKDTETGESYGKPQDWGDNDWLVVDTLSMLGQAAMLYTLSQNNRMGQKIRLMDWGEAIRRVEGVPMFLKALPINIIMTAHLARLESDHEEDDDDQPQGGRKAGGSRKRPGNYDMRYPATLGRKLPPKIGGYFTTILQAKRVGNGINATRVIRTVPDSDVDVKVPLQQGKQVEVPIDGLFSIIQAIRGDKS